MKKFLGVIIGMSFCFSQDIHILVDSACTYSLWTQMHEIIGYCEEVDGIQIVTRNFEHTGLNANQLPGDLSYVYRDYNLASSASRYPTSIASVKPYISYPYLINAQWGGISAQWESGGWFSSSWELSVDIGPGDVDVHKLIGKKLPNGRILFIGVTEYNSILYRTWDSTLTNPISGGLIANSAGYWGYDINGGIAYVFYYSIVNDTLVYYRTTTDGINWSLEQVWHLSFTPPYQNTKILFRQMALNDNGEPRLVFDAVNNDDNEYPWYGRIYVSVNSGVPPIQVSSSFSAPDTECFYPTIATGGNYCAVLYCMAKNNSPDTLTRWDFYSVWSTDNGATWGQPINCTQSLTYNPGLPQIAKRVDITRGRIYYTYCTLKYTNTDPYYAILTAHPNDCPAYLYLGASSYTGIEETANSHFAFHNPQLEVYPNPFHKNLTIKFQAEVHSNQKSVVGITIFDASGRLVKQYNNLTIQPFNQIVWCGDDELRRRLPPGIYFLVLKSGTLLATEKIVKLD